MAQVTRETCRLIINAFEHKDTLYPLTRWELAQLAYAWLEREDRRTSIGDTPAPQSTEGGAPSAEWRCSQLCVRSDCAEAKKCLATRGMQGVGRG